MNRNVVSIFLVIALLLPATSGCQGRMIETDKEIEAEEKNAVTIKTVSMFGGIDPNATVYEAINKEFMEEYSYITIEDNSQSSDEDWKASVAADFAVGNEPDVIQFFADATASTILATDKFVTIEEIRKEYPEYARDTLESALEAVTNPDGIQRAVPTTGYWEGLYCNQDLFEKYHVELPTDWDSLLRAIRVFRANGIIPIACSLSNVPHYWMEYLMLYTSGPDIYTSIPEEAPEEWVTALNTFQVLREMGAFPKDTDTVDEAYIGQLFLDKKAAMQLNGSWFIGAIEDTENTVVIAFPGVENQKAQPGAMVGGISSGFYITKKAWNDPEKRDAAVKFVMAHTSKSAVQRYWEAGGAISKAAVEVEPIAGMTKLALSALAYANSATSISTPTDSRIGQGAYNIMTANIVKISKGDADAKVILDEALAMYHERKR